MKRIRVKISVTHLLTCNGKLITRYAFMAAIILALSSCSKVKPYSIVDSSANTIKFDVGCDGNDTLAETSWRIYCWKYNVDPVNPSDEEETNKIEKRGYIKYGIKAKEGSREYKKLQKRAQKNSSMSPSDAKKERIKNDIKKDIKQSTKRGLDQTRNAFVPHKKVK